jgi:hypothetical protein
MKKIALILISISILIGCQSGNQENLPNEFIPLNETGEIKKDTRKLIKEADISFKTSDIDIAFEQIRTLSESNGAYISEEDKFEYSNKTGYNITIRVPKDNFDTLIVLILDNVEVKELENKRIEIKDVTEQFIDIESRLKIKRETEQKYLELLKRAKTLDETLKIEKLLAGIREEIESTEGRLKYLTDKVQYSTIRIRVFDSIKYSKRFFSDFCDALKDGWQVFLHVLTLLGHLWVVILVFFLIRWGVIYYKREIKNKNNAA